MQHPVKGSAPAGTERGEARLRKRSSSEPIRETSGLVAAASCWPWLADPGALVRVPDLQRSPTGLPKARLLTPAHFHPLRYLHQPHLLVWDGAAASYACEAGIRSSGEPRLRCGYWEELTAV